MANKYDVATLCDSFNSQASTYERRLGGSTRRVIEAILPLLSPLPNNPIILDNACGPGFAAEEILSCISNARVYAVDLAPGMIDLLRKLLSAKGWENRVETAMLDGVNLNAYTDENFDASIINFGIFFFSDAALGTREIYRTLKVAGKAAVTCWKEVPFLAILHAVQAVIKPGSLPLSLPILEEWTHRETLERALLAGGFEEIEVREKEVMWRNKGVDEAAKGFADNFVNMVGDQWTEEEKERILPVTEEVLKAPQGKQFIVESQGMIGCRMVAWIGIGIKTQI
ncbi:Methyltransferase type 11 protein [Rutstroemia sp. NJR-2017a WRK4]|nr:Methyltransferase type 11 protein [Rutstroemia sp. NJR-2017a WRK4]